MKSKISSVAENIVETRKQNVILTCQSVDIEYYHRRLISSCTSEKQFIFRLCNKQVQSSILPVCIGAKGHISQDVNIYERSKYFTY